MRVITLAALLLATPVAAQAQVRVDGAQGDSLTLRCLVADCRPRIRLIANGSAPVHVRIAVDSVERSDFALFPVEWSIAGLPDGTDTVTVTALRPALITLQAVLAERGRYVGALSLIDKDSRTSTRLIITRARAAPLVEVSGLSTIQATTGDVRFWLALRDTAGRSHDVTSVMFDSLARTVGAAKFQARFDTIAVGRDVQCSAIRDTLGSKGTNGKPLARDSAAPKLTVPADGALRLALCIRGLDDPGEYTGVVRINLADGPPMPRAVTIMVKAKWGWALAAIGIGILLALALRQFAQVTRPRLVREVQIERLLARVESVERETRADDTETKDAISLLQERVALIRDEVENNSAADVDARLTVLDRQLSLLRSWRNARDFVAAIEPARLRAQFRGTLAAALDVVRRRTATADDLTKAEASLEELPGNVRTAVETELRAVAKALLAQVVDLEGRVQHPVPREKLSKIRADVERATTALDEEKFEDARRVLDAARLGLLRLLAEEQKATIDPAKPLLGMTQAAWAPEASKLTELLAEVATLENADAAAELLDRVNRRLVDLRASGLDMYVQDQHTLIEANNNLTPDEKTELKNAVAQPLGGLADVRRQAAEGRFSEAAAGLDKIGKEIAEALKRGTASGKRLGGPEAAPPVAADVVVPPQVSRLPSAPEKLALDRGGRARGARQRLAVGDFLFLAAGAAIALLLGFKVLYAENATWGSLTDWLAAVLWGLGVTQTSGAAFEGFTSLSEKLKK